ncbi:MAG: hypothetical protein ACKOWN_00195 [Microbacteriaceae bacterium]
MAFTKKGGDHVADESTTEAPVASTNKARKPLTIAAIVGGGVLALGAAFGVGLVAGHAAPAFPGGPEFAAGAGPIGGHGDRDGDHRGGPQGFQGQFEATPGDAGNPPPGGDFCHPGDGHTHDAQGNDVAPSGSAEGFTCQTGPAEGSTGTVPAPGTTTAP